MRELRFWCTHGGVRASEVPQAVRVYPTPWTVDAGLLTPTLKKRRAPLRPPPGDIAFCREVEKYPALVVHGPMQATLLMEAAIRHTGRAPARFSFRGVHPLFLGDGLRDALDPKDR